MIWPIKLVGTLQRLFLGMRHYAGVLCSCTVRIHWLRCKTVNDSFKSAKPGGTRKWIFFKHKGMYAHFNDVLFCINAGWHVARTMFEYISWLAHSNNDLWVPKPFGTWQRWVFWPVSLSDETFVHSNGGFWVGKPACTCLLEFFNPFPHNDTFWRPWETSLLKIL